MEYQLYEILLLFSIYSILGWAAVGFLFALKGNGFANRGLCRGPYLMSFGIGALAVLRGSIFLETVCRLGSPQYFAGVFGLGVSAGLVLGLSSMAVCNGISGAKKVRFLWYHPILAGVLALLLVFHINYLVTAIIRTVSPWIHLIFLVIFFMCFLPETVDGLIALWRLRKKENISEEKRIR